jgi:membrane peptidoglycan carboxypeptidase
VVKGKILGGAPRAGRWTRHAEDSRLGGRHRGSIIALLVLALLIVGGIGGYLYWADQRLRAGLLAQEREARQRPDWVPLADVPPHVRHAFGVVVDTTFFTRRSLRRGEGEASVSRRLVRQVHQLDGSLAGEALELAMAPILEIRRPRQRLLEMYINRVAMGRTENWSVFGAQHAARDYFGKDLRRVTPGEAAALAGILLPPRLDDPDAHPGAVGARRNEVLRRMFAAGHIDEETYAAARTEPLGFQPGIEHAPMSRPEDWSSRPEVIRLPEELRPRPEPEQPQAQ